MLVRQLVGPLAGQIVDLPYHVATGCLAVGTACLPDETPKVRGMKPFVSELEPAPAQTPAPAPVPVAVTEEPQEPQAPGLNEKKNKKFKVFNKPAR